MKRETVTISKDLMQKIMQFFLKDLEDYTGATRDDYDDDALVSQIYDELFALDPQLRTHADIIKQNREHQRKLLEEASKKLMENIGHNGVKKVQVTEEAVNEIISAIKEEIELFDEDDVKAEVSDEKKREIAQQTREIALDKADDDQIEERIQYEVQKAHDEGFDHYGDLISYDLSKEIIQDAYLEALNY